MMHHTVEDYVDDLVVKSREGRDPLKHLEDVFKRCSKFNMRMNPLKCAFCVTAGKFVGFLVLKHRIDADETKIKSIVEMPAPHSQRTLKRFLEKVSHLQRFIPALAEITAPFSDLLKGKAVFGWKDEHCEAFNKVKAAQASPQTNIAPQAGKPLILYLTSTSRSIRAFLVQKVEGVEQSVYYIN